MFEETERKPVRRRITVMSRSSRRLLLYDVIRPVRAVERQYVFAPCGGLWLFNHECLAEIGGVIVFLRDRGTNAPRRRKMRNSSYEREARSGGTGMRTLHLKRKT